MQDEENLMDAKMNEAGAKSGDERFMIAGRSPAIFQPLPHRHLLTTAGHFQPSRGGGGHAMSRRLLSIREEEWPGKVHAARYCVHALAKMCGVSAERRKSRPFYSDGGGLPGRRYAGWGNVWGVDPG